MMWSECSGDCGERSVCHGEVVDDTLFRTVREDLPLGLVGDFAFSMQVRERVQPLVTQRALSALAAVPCPVAGPHAGREGIEDQPQTMVFEQVGSVLG